MAKYDYDIGIIGGGAAGLTVASGAAQFGAKTVLIEREPHLGGDCLHYGCVPSKTLIKTASVMHAVRTADRYGLPNIIPGPVDFELVGTRIKSVIATIQAHDSETRFCSLGVRVLYGEPTFEDDHTVRLGNRQAISAKFWVIATGSSAHVPGIEGIDRVPYLTNRDIFSLKKLPTSMLILGGGPIAAEMSQAFSRLGTKVTVIESGPQMLGREDKDMALAVMRNLEDESVEICTGASVLRVRSVTGGIEADIKTAAAERTVRAEYLLVAAGRSANIRGLGLELIDVDYTPRGIKVDNRLRTTRPHIFAAGDVTGAYQFTHAAGYEGGVVIANTIFRIPRKTDYKFFPWCTYTDPELASIGMNERAAKEAGLAYTVWSESFRDNDRALAEGESEGMIKLILDERERPLGVQVLGAHAGDLIAQWATAIGGGMRMSTMASIVLPYPTRAEITKRVAGAFISKKLFSDRVRKGLHMIFGLKGRACNPGTPDE